MNKKQIFKSIQNSVNDITPDIFEKVSTANIVPQRTEDFIMKNTQINYKANTPKIVIAFTTVVALITLIVGGGYYYKKNKVVTTISFDVNPSIEMTANEYDEILDVYALNDDGTEILKDLDFDKTNVTQAVDEVVNSLVENGFIDEEKSSILMSVESSDEQKENQLSDNIASNIEQNLSQKNIEPTIFSQHGKSDNSTAALAKQHNISVNKMAFIKNITKKNPEIDIKDLTSLNIEEIKDLMNEKKVNLDEVVEKKNQIKEQNQGQDNKNTNQIREKASSNANEKAKDNENTVQERVSSNQSEKAQEKTNQIKDKISSNSNEKAKDNENTVQERVSSNQSEKAEEKTNQIKEKVSNNSNEKSNGKK